MGSTSLVGRRALARSAWLALAGAVLFLPACGWDGHFAVLGYTTRPNYDTCYHTIRVPIFKTRSFFSVVPVPGLEMELTRAVIREIEDKTPYKVVSDDHAADTELVGNILLFGKALINPGLENSSREVETDMVVELYWRDIHTGKILSRPPRRFGEPIPPEPRVPTPLTDPLQETPGLARAVPLVSP